MSSYKESLLVGLVRIMANVLMLAALFLAMYNASHSSGSSMLIFCAWFFGITICVWVAAWYLIRLIREKGQSRAESFLLLPHCTEPCLVRWEVVEHSPLNVNKTGGVAKEK
ncbi:MAG: hypothetical protein IJU79_03460 [Desulfovibrionaceae bacterium]|nr:hypothetical protein [Desulfovibrionaceae bacterium]